MNEKELDRKAEIFVDNYLKKYSELIPILSLRQLFQEMYKGGVKEKSFEKSNTLDEKELKRRASKYEENAEYVEVDDYGHKVYNSIDIEEAYIAGAKESIPEWHDLRKNSNDLPPMKRYGQISNPVWIYIKDWGVEVGSYNYERKTWDWSIQYQKLSHQVLAWYEIPVFDENS